MLFFFNGYCNALDCYLISLKINEETNDSTMLCATFSNIGNVYYMQKEFLKALDYYFRALAISKEIKSGVLLPRILNNISGMYFKQNRDVEAKKYIEEALHTVSSLDNPILYTLILANFGEISFRQKKYDESIDSLKKALILSEKFNNRQIMIEVCKTLGDLYLSLYFNYNDFNKSHKDFNISKTSALNISIDYLERAKLISDEAHDNREYIDILSNLSIANKELGNFAIAYRYLAQKDSLKDVLFSKENYTQIASMEVKLEQEKLAKQKAIQEKERLIVLISISLLSIIIIILAIFLIKIRKSNIILNTQNRIIKEHVDEIDTLNVNLTKREQELIEVNLTKDKFYTIISHDLKNPILNFNILIELISTYYFKFTDDERISHIETLKTSSNNVLKLLENLLTWSRLQSNNISFVPENFDICKIISEEIKLQHDIAINKDIEIKSDLPKNVFAYADIDMIRTVFRNLLSNAIKYSNRKSLVSITIAQDNEMIITHIIDKGVGISEETRNKIFRFDGQIFMFWH